MQNIKLGIVGARRGSNFIASCNAIDGVQVHAVCDINEQALKTCQEEMGVELGYLDYEEMLDKAGLDAVLISTPMQLHVSQSIAALERDIHVLSEVTAGVSIEECRQLVNACKNSDGIYMMAENYTYARSNQLIKELVRQGLFGTTYYAEGEYLHEIKEYAQTTPWRITGMMELEGISYCTHSLGPILQWMPGDRVVKVSCEAAGSRHSNADGKPYCQAASTMMCKTEKDALITIQVDLVSDRPHAGSNYRLQGTDGCYESSRGGPWDKDKIWLRERDADYRWRELAQFAEIPELAEKYLPRIWHNVPEVARRSGHGGGDYFTMLDFIRTVRGECPNPIDVHTAMDMTLPGLISQQSILQDAAWLDVPDSREW